MKKKYYIPFLMIGALLVFALLPIANYDVDQWRVLHNDYKHSYTGVSPNKSYLKVRYLLDHKKKYDTIMMGSSRSGYMDSRLISKNSYNMKFNFSLAKMHLNNLKVLLENNVHIKKLWLGVNDYEIWKDPNDFTYDYQRRLFKTDLAYQLETYSLYLLRKINYTEVKVLKGRLNLQPSEELTYPDKANMQTARKREEFTLSHRALWIEKMTKIPPTLLGYKDDTYRIDKSISEIDQIKKLCKKHNIDLTVFMYPTYYKTYLHFNQYKIETFKRKLAEVVDFYDFYDLSSFTRDPFKWQDSSHFHASIGDYIIRSIQENKFLVTKENVEQRLNENRVLIKDFFRSPLPIKVIYQFNENIPVGELKEIFSLENDKYSYFKNNHFKLMKQKDFIEMTIYGNDPIFIFDQTKAKSENIILRCSIESPTDTAFTIYYKHISSANYSENSKMQIDLKKGLNEFSLLIPSSYIHNHMRIDIADKVGKYKIKDFTMYEFE